MTRQAAHVRPSFAHLLHLSDELGVFEHASYDEPRREHGYCVDDVARALVVTCREPDPDPAQRHLVDVCLAFVLAAIAPDGCCRNRRDSTGAWTDEPTVEDCWGRALWGLGYAAVHAPTDALRDAARAGFDVAARGRSPHRHAMAFAALGAGELLLAEPTHVGALALLIDAVAVVDGPGTDEKWPWPEPRLRYANGSVAEAVLVAGMALDDPRLVDRGLELLSFLVRTETYHGHLSVTPVVGRGPTDARPAYDQQPIEVAAIADAGARAFVASRDDRWLRAVDLAWAWFCGVNDTATVMVDHATGAGYDGLQPLGRNENRGAESTLAALGTAQQALLPVAAR